MDLDMVVGAWVGDLPRAREMGSVRTRFGACPE